MNKFTCKCPSPGCDFELTVLAESLKEAQEKMVEEEETHMIDKHPDLPVLTYEKKRECISKRIRFVCKAGD